MGPTSGVPWLLPWMTCMPGLQRSGVPEQTPVIAACCSTGDRSSPFIWRLALLPRFDGVTRARCLLLGADAALRRTRHDKFARSEFGQL